MSVNASLAEPINCVFMGTSASSGTAQALLVQTGKGSFSGQIAGKLALRPQLTEFEHGVRRFGYLLTHIMLVMVVEVVVVNIFMAKPRRWDTDVYP